MYSKKLLIPIISDDIYFIRGSLFMDDKFTVMPLHLDSADNFDRFCELCDQNSDQLHAVVFCARNVTSLRKLISSLSKTSIPVFILTDSLKIPSPLLVMKRFHIMNKKIAKIKLISMLRATNRNIYRREVRISPRQMIVMKSLMSEKTAAEIASEHNVSIKTVSSHKMTFLKSVGCRNLPQAFGLLNHIFLM